MATNILGSLMSSAQGYASSAMSASRRSKPGQQKPEKSLDEKLVEKWLPGVIQSHDVAILEQNRAMLESMGANVDNLIGMARTKTTPELKQEEAQRSLRVLLGLEQPQQTQPSAPQPTPAEESAQMSLIETKSSERMAAQPSPGYNQRYRATNYNIDENGIITNVQMSENTTDFDRFIERQTKRGKITKAQAESLRDAHDLLQENNYIGLKPNVKLEQDAQGNWNNVVNFPERPDIAPFVIQGTKTPVNEPTLTTAQVDERYRQIVMAEDQGQPVSLEDQEHAVRSAA